MKNLDNRVGEGRERQNIVYMLADTGARSLGTPLLADIHADMTDAEQVILQSAPLGR